MPTNFITPNATIAYHAHQLDAIDWMIGRESPSASYFRGGVEGDEMGLGKTYTTIGLLLNNPVPDTLILVPPSLEHQWRKALEESSISYRILLAGKSGFTTVAGSRDFCATLCTYDRAVNRIDLINETHYDRLVCDEGHVFKNGKSTRRFRTLSTIVAPRRWILTGTPVHNDKSDFKNLCVFLGCKQALTTEGLTKVADAVMVRRVVSDVSEAVESMPEAPVHYVHPVKMPEGSEERVVFDALVARLDSAIEAHARTWIILKLYLRIRQFIADPAIYVNAMNREYKGKYTRPAWTGTRSKMAAFRQYMSTTTKVPTIVFTNFREELEEADRILTGLGFRTFSVQGGMSADSRAAAIEESKVAAAAGEPTVILVQIVAGGCGLNLQHCHRVVMLSSHWNPAIVDQAIARAYRMGQSSRVEVHHFVLADDAELNIDRKIASAHGRKRQAAVEVHSKLITESAIEYEALRDILDNSIELPEEDYEGEDPTPVTSTTETTVGMGVAAVAIVAPLASVATVAPMT